MNVLATKLAEKNVGEPAHSSGRLWVDDNVGEAVHIHFRNVRIDLSVDDYFTVIDQMREAQNNLEQWE